MFFFPSHDHLTHFRQALALIKSLCTHQQPLQTFTQFFKQVFRHCLNPFFVLCSAYFPGYVYKLRYGTIKGRVGKEVCRNQKQYARF